MIAPRPEALRLPAEIRHEKQPENLPVAPKVTVAVTRTEELPVSKPVIPKQLVKTNVFSTGSSQTPTMAAAPAKVQTGGFGDPNGDPTKETKGHPVTIAQVGSFDLPSGPGYGNGTGGAKGTRGVVASAGFGNGTATGSSANPGFPSSAMTSTTTGKLTSFTAGGIATGCIGWSSR